MFEDPDAFRKVVYGGELNETERMRAWIFVRATLRGFETQLFHYTMGLLDEQEWQNLQNTIQNTMLLPGVKEFWPELRDVVSPQLQKQIDAYYASDMPGPAQHA